MFFSSKVPINEARQKYLDLPKLISKFTHLKIFMEDGEAAQMKYALTEACTEHDIACSVTLVDMDLYCSIFSRKTTKFTNFPERIKLHASKSIPRTILLCTYVKEV